MPFTTRGAPRLYYETTGPKEGADLILIHGLGAQMIAWYPGFVEALHRSGFRVTRFDNRDVGLSDKMDEARDYRLEDMADDVAQLMDHLGLTKAHVAGQSMGGMIAQLFALRHPDRLASLSLIYTAPGPAYLRDDDEVRRVRGEAPATTRDDAIRQHIAREYLSGAEGMTEAWVETHAAEVIDRCYCPEGVARHERATFGAPDRTGELWAITAPTAIFHGRDDPLLHWHGAATMAAAIPNCDLHVYDHMRHQIPPRLWPDVGRAMARTAARCAAVDPMKES